jgi:hypothetical protein
MRKIRSASFLFSLLTAVVVLSGCMSNGNPIPTQISENVAISDSMTSPTTMASSKSNPEISDIPESMPDDFAIDFEYWILPEQKNIMDTFTGSMQKDLILNGTSKSAFSCKKEDLEAIYSKMTELSIFELSGNIISDSFHVSPNEIFTIRYRINGKEFLLSGDSSTLISEKEGANDLPVFVNYLRDLMKETPEYKEMPDSEGGYD